MSGDLNITVMTSECSCYRRVMLYVAISLIGLIILSGTIGESKVR